MAKSITVTNQELSWATYYLAHNEIGVNTAQEMSGYVESYQLPALFQEAYTTLNIRTGHQVDKITPAALKTLVVANLYKLKQSGNHDIPYLANIHIDRVCYEMLGIDIPPTDLSISTYVDQDSRKPGDAYMLPYNYKIGSAKENIHASVTIIDYGAQGPEGSFNINNYQYSLAIKTSIDEVQNDNTTVKYLNLRFPKPYSGTYNIKLLEQKSDSTIEEKEVDELVVKIDNIKELYIEGRFSCNANYKIRADIELLEAIANDIHNPYKDNDIEDQYHYECQAIGDCASISIE